MLRTDLQIDVYVLTSCPYQPLCHVWPFQMKEIQDKICRFEQKEMLTEKERQQLNCLRDLLFTDQLAVMQHQQRTPAVVTECKRDEKPKPVVNMS